MKLTCKKFMATVDSLSVLSDENVPFTGEKLIKHQKLDPLITVLRQQAYTHKEADKVPHCFCFRDGILMRKWRSPLAPANHGWETKHAGSVPWMCTATRATISTRDTNIWPVRCAQNFVSPT